MRENKPYKASFFKVKWQKIKNKHKKISEMTPNELIEAKKRRKEAQYDWNALTLIFALSAVVWFIFPIVRMHVKFTVFDYDFGGVSENIGFMTLFNENSIFRVIKNFSQNGDFSSLFDGSVDGILGSLLNSVTSQFQNTIVQLKGLIPYAITSGVLYIISLVLRLVSGVIYAVKKKINPCIIMQSVSFVIFTVAGGLLLYIMNMAEACMPTLINMELTLQYGIIFQYVTAGLTVISIVIRKCLKDIKVKTTD